MNTTTWPDSARSLRAPELSRLQETNPPVHDIIAHPLLRKCLELTLSAELNEKGKSFKGRSDAAVECCQLLARVSGASSTGADWAMSVLSVGLLTKKSARGKGQERLQLLLADHFFCHVFQNADSAFEELFEEEIWHDSCALHVCVLAVLLDHCGTAFTGRYMWELTNGHIDRSLAVLSAFLRAFAGVEKSENVR